MYFIFYAMIMIPIWIIQEPLHSHIRSYELVIAEEQHRAHAEQWLSFSKRQN